MVINFKVLTNPNPKQLEAAQNILNTGFYPNYSKMIMGQVGAMVVRHELGKSKAFVNYVLKDLFMRTILEPVNFREYTKTEPYWTEDNVPQNIPIIGIKFKNGAHNLIILDDKGTVRQRKLLGTPNKRVLNSKREGAFTTNEYLKLEKILWTFKEAIKNHVKIYEDHILKYGETLKTKDIIEDVKNSDEKEGITTELDVYRRYS